MDMLGLEVARALQFFFTSTQYNQVNHIVLSGGCAAIPGRRRGGRQAHPGQHHRRQSVRQHAAVLEDPAQDPDAGRAVADGGVRPGDAEVRSMIRINLLPHREIRRKQQQQQFFIALGVVVVRRRRRSGSSCTRYLDDQLEDAAGPQHVPAGRDRQARQADRRDQEAQGADRGAARRARRWSKRCRATAPRPCTCSTSWCGSCPTAST